MGRPDRTHGIDDATRQLTLSAIMLTVLTSLVIVWQWQTRIEPVPVVTLFGSEPDLELGASSLLPILLISLGFTVGTLLPVFVPAFGRFPVVVTPENAEPLYRESERLHAWISVLIQVVVAAAAAMLLLAGTVWLLGIIAGVVVIAAVWFRGYATLATNQFLREQGGMR